MFGRKHRDLERRVAALEERLDARRWELPPANDIDIDDLPELPDYSVGCWDDDMVEAARRSGKAWQPHGYV